MYFFVLFCFVLFRFFFPWRPRRADYREIVSATLKNCILLLLLFIIIDIIIVNKLES